MMAPVDYLDGLPPDASAWPAELASLGESARREVTAWLVREWIFGRLEPRLSGGSTHPDGLRPLRRALAAALPGLLYPSPGDARFPESDDEVRRWCWIEGWLCLDQDEDLMLMGDDNRVPLLEEAAGACPKRDYVLSIVAHDVRDQLHASLFAGPDAVRACVARSASLLPHARAAGADGLVRYLERVASWATPRPVERAEAVDRCRGVHRCHEPASAEVALIDGAWVWSPPHAGQQGAKVFIDRRTGAMWGESAKPKERSKRRKR